MYKKIIIFGFIVSLLGILDSVSPLLFETDLTSKIFTVLRFLTHYFSLDISFDFLTDQLFGINVSMINKVNLIAAFLLFVATLTYLISKGKNSVLIRILFSVLLISTILGCLRMLLFLIYYIQNKSNTDLQVFYVVMFFLSILKDIFVFYLTFQFLKYLQNSIELEKEKQLLASGDEYFNLIDTKSSLRLFHHLFDMILFWLIVFSFNSANTIHLFSSVFNFHSVLFIELFELFLIIVLYFLYYILFEFLFGISPAKILTGSRVVSFDDSKLSFGQIMIRTLCRRIPFEVFSFFGAEGWHDKLSKTRVVNEKNISAEHLWSKILFFLLLVIAIYLAILDYSGRF